MGLDGEPYGVPLSYVYREDEIYFHSAPEGRKVENLCTEAKRVSAWWVKLRCSQKNSAHVTRAQSLQVRFANWKAKKESGAGSARRKVCAGISTTGRRVHRRGREHDRVFALRCAMSPENGGANLRSAACIISVCEFSYQRYRSHNRLVATTQARVRWNLSISPGNCTLCIVHCYMQPPEREDLGVALGNSVFVQWLHAGGPPPSRLKDGAAKVTPPAKPHRLSKFEFPRVIRLGNCAPLMVRSTLKVSNRHGILH